VLVLVQQVIRDQIVFNAQEELIFSRVRILVLPKVMQEPVLAYAQHSLQEAIVKQENLVQLV
jgi:hypothetical protein